MRRLSRYILFECSLYALTALMVFTFLFLLPQVLRLADLWVNKGVAVSVLGWMIVLLTPKLVVSSLPMALLLGILLVLGRMSEESEIVVIKASGISMIQMARPITLLVLVASLLALLLNFHTVPASRHALSQIKDALLTASPLVIKAQTFNQSIEGLTLYINAQDPGGRTFKGILIHDERDKEMPVTLMAQSGQLQILPDGATFYLANGSRYLKKPGAGYQQLQFATYTLDLGGSFGFQVGERHKRIEELTTTELWQQLFHDDREMAFQASLEWHRRLSFSAAILILGLLSIPLGIQSPRSGRAYGFIVAIGILTIHLLLLSLGGALASKGTVVPLVGYWVPNAFMALLALHVTVRTNQERPFLIMELMAALLASLPSKMLRPDRPEHQSHRERV